MDSDSTGRGSLQRKEMRTQAPRERTWGGDGCPPALDGGLGSITSPAHTGIWDSSPQRGHEINV